MSLEGYGRVHVPLQAGTHELIVSLSKPMPSSMLGYIGSFFGYQPELLQPKTLANTSGSHCKLYDDEYTQNINEEEDILRNVAKSLAKLF